MAQIVQTADSFSFWDTLCIELSSNNKKEIIWNNWTPQCMWEK